MNLKASFIKCLVVFSCIIALTACHEAIERPIMSEQIFVSADSAYDVRNLHLLLRPQCDWVMVFDNDGRIDQQRIHADGPLSDNNLLIRSPKMEQMVLCGYDSVRYTIAIQVGDEHKYVVIQPHALNKGYWHHWDGRTLEYEPPLIHFTPSE